MVTAPRRTDKGCHEYDCGCQNIGGGPGTVGTIVVPGPDEPQEQLGEDRDGVGADPAAVVQDHDRPGFTAPRIRSRRTSGGGRR